MWGPGGGGETGNLASRHVSHRREPIRRSADPEGSALYREEVQGKGGLSSPAPGAAPRKPASAHQAPLTRQRRREPWVTSREGRPVCFRSFVHPVLGFLIQAGKNFEVLENSECACFYRICSSASIATHNEEPRQKEWGCQAIRQHFQPKKQPGASGSRTSGSPGAARPGGLHGTS